MATHSNVLAWRIPGMAEPRGLPSMGSHRVGHDWSDLAATAAAKVIECSYFQNLNCIVSTLIKAWSLVTSCGVNFSHAPTAFCLSTQLPPLVPEDRYPMNIHNGLLLHYTNQQQDRNKQKRNKQANLSWRQSKLSPVAPWKTSVVNRNINSLEVMFMILQIADRAKWTLSD